MNVKNKGLMAIEFVLTPSLTKAQCKIIWKKMLTLFSISILRLYLLR